MPAVCQIWCDFEIFSAVQNTEAVHAEVRTEMSTACTNVENSSDEFECIRALVKISRQMLGKCKVAITMPPAESEDLRQALLGGNSESLDEMWKAGSSVLSQEESPPPPP
eukprot:4697183-Amphidinium_carterae.1